MNRIYHYVGISKQNFHQQLNRQIKRKEEENYLLHVIRQVRQGHPRMGAETLYSKIKPEQFNRDQFTELYNANGFRLRQVRNYRRTTDSNGVIRFDNLLLNFELTGVNQVFVSDITYYELGERFYYLTFMMDLFSRMIKGYVASKTLRTIDTTIPALKMVLDKLPKDSKPIIHSDGGGQYYCKEFLELGKGRFNHSMCESVYENAHAERINGIIKNDYIKPSDPGNFEQLEKVLQNVIYRYNYERPHHSLEMLTPNQYEIKHLKDEQIKKKSYHYNIELNMI